ncbi:MAG: tetratricopeptide (TPR) repeat protein [Planctomycetota bacterium]|jgi:tetratricopeptide (TPR) repeat protein
MLISASKSRPAAVLVGMCALLACMAACGDGQLERDAGLDPNSGSAPDVPWPSDLSGYDEELVQALESTRDELLADSFSAERWTRLGLLYQAHSLHEFAEGCYARTITLDAADAKSWYRLAITRTRLGIEDGALQAFAKVHDLAPDYAPAWRKCGRYLVELGYPERAKSYFVEALRLDPGDVSSQLGLIQVQLDEGDVAGALAAHDKIEKVQPGNQALAHRLRGQALARLGRVDEAQQELRLGIGARASGADPWMREMDAVKIGDLELGPSATLLRADRMAAAGRFDNALRLLNALAERVSDDERVYKMLGRTYVRAQRWTEALQAWEMATKLVDQDARLWLALAATRREVQQFGPGRDAAIRARELDPSSVEAYLIEADISLRLGDFESIASCHQYAESAGIESADLEVAAGKAWIERGSPQDAAKHFLRATQWNDDLADAWAGLAVTQLEAKDRSGAKASLARLVAIDAAHPIASVIQQQLDQEGDRP